MPKGLPPGHARPREAPPPPPPPPGVPSLPALPLLPRHILLLSREPAPAVAPCPPAPFEPLRPSTPSVPLLFSAPPPAITQVPLLYCADCALCLGCLCRHCCFVRPLP